MAYCPVNESCGSFPIDRLKVHIQLKHLLLDFTSEVTCKQKNCVKPFPNWSKYRRHLVEFHSIPLSDSSTFSDNLDVQKSTLEIVDLEYCNEPVDNDVDEVFSIIDARKSIYKVFLEFVGKMYAVANIPKSFVQTIVSDINSILKEVLSQIQMCCKSKSGESRNDCALEIVQETLEVVGQFRSEHRRLSLLQKSGCFIMPKPYVVGSGMKEKRIAGRIVNELVPLTGQYVPIRRVLECFFSMPGVLKEVLEYVNQLENEDFGILSNFVQGVLWKFKKERDFKDKLVLPLFFYHDEFEVNNPLGSHSCIQKLGGTYFSIPCLPPDQKSLLDNIFLALLTYSSDRKSDDCTAARNPQIFRRLITQINALQKYGIDVEINGQMEKLYFGFGLLLGDNEGLNSTQEYAAASASYCRFCKATSADVKKDCYEKENLLRCISEYENDVKVSYKVSGVKGLSVWNEIDGHHIYNNYSLDILHDMEEGALKYGMYHVVNHYVNVAKKNVSLDILNNRIKTFNFYDSGLSNKPQLISDRDLNFEKRLKMSGSEMHNFVLAFPLLIGDLIEHDKVWDFYLVLRKITLIVYAPEIQESYVDALGELVATHHKLYLELFKDNLKLKHHNMVHAGRVIKQSGPLCHLSTYRYEGRHRPNKQRAAATSSRRDPALTVACKDQLNLCHRLISNEGFRHRFEMGPSYVPSLEEIADIALPDFFGKDIMEVSWVDVKGTRYRENMIVCHDIEEVHGLPQFGKIGRIFCNDQSEAVFYLQCLYTVGLDEKLASYVVQETDSYLSVPVENLITFSPALFAFRGENIYVSLRHAL